MTVSKSISNTLLVLCVCVSNLLYAQQANDSMNNTFLWSNIIPYKLSKDNKWLYVNQFFTDQKKTPLAFYINTQNNKIVYSLSNDLLVNNINIEKQYDTLILKDLDNTKQFKTFNNIKDLKTIASKNIIILTNKANELSIQEINKDLSKNKILFSAKDVTTFILSPNNQNVIYQKNNRTKDLHYLNLLTWEEKKISPLLYDLTSVLWSPDQGTIAVTNQDNTINIIDLNQPKTKEIQLENSKIENLQLNFFSNNDLYIEYNIISNVTYPETEYVDIWNGNTKYLVPNNFKLKHQIFYKALVYNKELDKSIYLNRRRDKFYLPIGIPNYILTYNPISTTKHFEASVEQKKQFHLLDINKDSIVSSFPYIKMSNLIKVSKDQKQILFPTIQDGVWSLFTIKTRKFRNFNTALFNESSFTPIWSEDSKKIYFQKENDLFRLHTDNFNHEKLSKLKTTDNKIKIVGGKNFDKNSKYLDDSSAFLFTSLSPNENMLLRFDNSITSQLYSTVNLIRTISDFNAEDLKSLAFTEENFNKAPVIKTLIDNKVNDIIYDYIPDSLYNWREIKVFTFKDKFGKNIKGYLKYPKDFNKSKSYPMIIEIYDTYNHLTKRFINVSQRHDMQLNDPFYNERGYFICKINTYVSEQGPGLSALDITIKGLNKILSLEPAINPNKIGLFGFSFGGYKTSFIATQTDRFTTIVSGGASHDLIGGQTYRYSYQRNIPDWEMSEKAQMQLKDSYKDNSTKYIANSPLLHAQNVNTPLLLYAGLKDINVHSENTSKMFIALLKYQKPVIALFYKNVGHGFSYSNKTEYLDFDNRLLQWFDYHLKDKKDILWINQGLDTNKYSLSKLDNL